MGWYSVARPAFEWWSSMSKNERDVLEVVMRPRKTKISKGSRAQSYFPGSSSTRLVTVPRGVSSPRQIKCGASLELLPSPRKTLIEFENKFKHIPQISKVFSKWMCLLHWTGNRNSIHLGHFYSNFMRRLAVIQAAGICGSSVRNLHLTMHL